MAQPYPLQGQIYLIKAICNLGDTKKRPAVVVSINLRNELSQTVLVVPFTSDTRSGETPTRILLIAGEGGLETDSLATCDHVLAVRKTYLEQGPYGSIDPRSLQRIQQGIQLAIGIYPVGAIMTP
ncbi:type II toxin-antitoxin system PemK/MazF family toxin [Leptolyngbya sp. CCNP1308]|uniref:type II toxin-antitoxin system PemK/MazF family toxin n=1 Tax=Leptolyngbya sp. CCNP1308 TaxID=3110255 RepID=UPI002B20931D|nr:type II toxin-antitoxin system PemK/MazF family toxin [Leptolyngbya sp. CCNP1308]MEA5450108.1 type II toxin-antitoxin system PemK/MazF family toxin [Leptolyngbya sp. CCNP1308]